MGKLIRTIMSTDTLSLCECTDGFWLYDKTRVMNLSMRAKTPQDAFVGAITYYQGRLTEVEKQYSELSAKVGNFVEQFKEEDHDVVEVVSGTLAGEVSRRKCYVRHNVVRPISDGPIRVFTSLVPVEPD